MQDEILCPYCGETFVFDDDAVDMMEYGVIVRCEKCDEKNREEDYAKFISADLLFYVERQYREKFIEEYDARGLYRQAIKEAYIEYHSKLFLRSKDHDGLYVTSKTDKGLPMIIYRR